MFQRTFGTRSSFNIASKCAIGMFQRTFGTRSSFNIASKYKILTVVKLKTQLKWKLKRLWRGYQGRDNPPVCRDLCTKYKLYRRSRVQPLWFFRRYSFERTISFCSLLNVMGCIAGWNPCQRRPLVNAHIGGC